MADNNQGNSGGTPATSVNTNQGDTPPARTANPPSDTSPVHGPVRAKPKAGLGTPMDKAPTICP